MIIAHYEMQESGRYRISVDDDELDIPGATSPWFRADQMALVSFNGHVYMAVSPFMEIGLTLGVFELRPVDTEIEQL